MSDSDDDEWEDGWNDAMDCDHAEADVDLLTGILQCRCGYSKTLTQSELNREATLQAEMYEAYSEECRQYDEAQKEQPTP